MASIASLPIRTIVEAGPEPTHTLRNVGFLVGGIGIGALALSTVLGIAAIDQGKALDRDCGLHALVSGERQLSHLTP